MHFVHKHYMYKKQGRTQGGGGGFKPPQNYKKIYCNFEIKLRSEKPMYTKPTKIATTRILNALRSAAAAIFALIPTPTGRRLAGASGGGWRGAVGESRAPRRALTDPAQFFGDRHCSALFTNLLIT